MATENSPPPARGDAPARNYGFALQLILLLAAAILTCKALSAGEVSAPVGLGLLALIAAIALWGALRHALTRIGK